MSEYTLSYTGAQVDELLGSVVDLESMFDSISSMSAGSVTQPVYFSNGNPIATTYALNATVPSGAKFTDTTYSAATTSAAGLMSASDKSKLNATTDYIVAQGTSGDWKYQKYNNGTAICYASFSVDRAIDSTWGALYECPAISPLNLPFSFTEIPLCIPSYISGDVWIGGFEISGNATKSSTPSLSLIRGTASEDTFTYNLGWFVIGKWK